MVIMNKNRWRSLKSLVALGATALGACSVDTSDVHFVDDDVFAQRTGNGGGPASNTGGAANIGGVANVAGALNKAGSPGLAGSSNGGSSPTAGSPPAGSGSGGMGIGGGGSPGECKKAVGNPTALLIDDLEDGDPALPMLGGREGGWYVSNDGTPTGMQMPATSMPPKPVSGGANGSRYAMHTSGSGFTLWGANMGLTLLHGPGRPPCPYDVTPHRGIRFYIMGTNSDGAVRFVVPTVQTHAVAQGGTCVGQGKCGDHFGYDIESVPTSWKQLSVSFDQLTQVGFGAPVVFDETQVLNVEFSLGRGATFDISVDQLEFY